jgi:hypothetical protein
MVAPIGLDQAVRALTGSGINEGKANLDLARRMAQTLHDVLAQEGQRRLVDCVVDITESLFDGEGQSASRQQLQAAGRLHLIAGSGTATVALGDDERVNVDQVVRLLEFTFRQTEISRLILKPRPTPERQPDLLV